MARPAPGPGRLLERIGDGAPRGMTVHDRTRLIGRLRHQLSIASAANISDAVPISSSQLPHGTACGGEEARLRAIGSRADERPSAVREGRTGRVGESAGASVKGSPKVCFANFGPQLVLAIPRPCRGALYQKRLWQSPRRLHASFRCLRSRADNSTPPSPQRGERAHAYVKAIASEILLNENIPVIPAEAGIPRLSRSAEWLWRQVAAPSPYVQSMEACISILNSSCNGIIALQHNPSGRGLSEPEPGRQPFNLKI